MDINNLSVYDSLTTQYIQEYIRLTHEFYPSFMNRINSTYYSLNVPKSNFNPDFRDFYANLTNSNHGGRYDAIYNVPIILSTNNTISENANEKGISIVESSQINCVVDPFINIKPKDGDLIAFKVGLNSIAVYSIISIETSSTLYRPFSRLSLQIVPNLSIERMQNFSISESGFIMQYHYIFEKELAQLIIKIQKIIKEYIDYFNIIYNSQMDAHLDNDNKVFLEFEKAFNEMINLYRIHFGTMKINKSYLYENLLISYADDNPFKRMLLPNDDNDINNLNNYKCTSRISRLSKSRRRSLNNRPKIYRLINSNNDNIFELYSNSIIDLNLPIDEINKWKLIKTDDFINNVKEQLNYFLDKECIINPTNMFINAIKLSQILYVLNKLVMPKISTRINNFTNVHNN